MTKQILLVDDVPLLRRSLAFDLDVLLARIKAILRR
jgi:hypothetical protein